jgi:hypothetical protein
MIADEHPEQSAADDAIAERHEAEIRQAVRETLAAALPALLWESDQIEAVRPHWMDDEYDLWAVVYQRVALELTAKIAEAVS